MNEKLKIYIDRLSEEKSITIDEAIPSSMLDIEEPFLSFSGLLKINGKTYIASDHLVLQLQINALAQSPCSICNEKVQIPIELKNFYHTEELNQIKGKIYNYLPIIREAVLLEVPDFVECNSNCKKRAELTQYLKLKSNSGKQQKENVNFPFANLK